MEKNVRRTDIFLSIVIPVYNVEKYLVRCLDSIIKQQVNFSFEIIAVNDSSTDTCYSILLDYKNKYDNFNIVNHTINKRLSVARKSGIDLCKGDYVMHVDSDDWIEEHSLQHIYDIVSNTLPDVVVFNYFVENSNQFRNSIDTISQTEFVTEKSEVHNFFLGAPWNKIVRRQLIKDTVYGSIGINNGEDLVYSTELFLKAKNILLSNFSYYVYFSNITSLSKVENSLNFLSNQKTVLTELTNVIKKYNPKESEINFVMKYYVSFIYLEIFKYHFKLSNETRMPILTLLNDIFSNIILDENEKVILKKSIKTKLTSLFEIVKRFGIKRTIGLIIK